MPFALSGSVGSALFPLPFYWKCIRRAAELSRAAISKAGAHGLRIKAMSTDSKRTDKLHGRQFYESIGSPKMILAPMVDQSEYVHQSSN